LRHREARSAVAIQPSRLLRSAANDAKAIPMKQPTVYMMANKRNGTIYTGVTSNLVQRASQHKQGMTKGFTWNYGCKLLVYYEVYEDIVAAKQIKAGRLMPLLPVRSACCR
jgi:putative endonuclease